MNLVSDSTSFVKDLEEVSKIPSKRVYVEVTIDSKRQKIYFRNSEEVLVGTVEWDLYLVRVEKARGKKMTVCGFSVAGNTFLYLEEAIFLMESGDLQVVNDGAPWSLQELYSLACEEPNFVLSTASLHVYLALRRLGYIVQRIAESERNKNYRAVKDKQWGGSEDVQRFSPESLPHLNCVDEWQMYYGWIPDRCSSFKKSAPPQPDFGLVAFSYANVHLGFPFNFDSNSLFL